MARTAPVPNIPPIPGMCPSLAVMGGGGAGGGGGGSGSGGDGSASGDGSGSGDDASGDGKTGGCSEGDPICPITGRMFLRIFDFGFNGPIPLRFEREYNSRACRHGGDFGWGWSHTLGWRLRVHRARIDVIDAAAKVQRFDGVIEHQGEALVNGLGWILTREAGGTFSLELLGEGEGRRLHFGPELGDGNHHVTRITDPNGNTFTVQRDEAGRLRAFTDAAGRAYATQLDQAGRVVQVAVALDAEGRERMTVATYTYDEEGNLASAADAEGYVARYRYQHHLMVEHQSVTGLTYFYRYDGATPDAYCVESYGSFPGRVDPALAEPIPPPPDHGPDVRSVKGIHHVKLTYLKEQRYTEVGSAIWPAPSEGEALTRYFGDEAGRAVKIVDPRGGVIDRVFEPSTGALVSERDTSNVPRQVSVDAAGTPDGFDDGTGNVSRTSFDETDGTVVTFRTDTQSEVRRRYDGRGNLVSVLHPDGTTEEYRHDERGLLLSHADRLGATTIYTHDAMGNCTQIVFPDGGVEKNEFDYLGRRTAHVTPSGERTEFTWDRRNEAVQKRYPDGTLCRATYDALRKITVLDDQGRISRFEYGGVGWLCKKTSPDGSVTEQRYDSFGNLVRVTNGRGQTFTVARNAAGQAVGYTTFEGVAYTMGRDAAGRVTRLRGPQGRLVVEHDDHGHVAKISTPEGDLEFTHGPGGLASMAGVGVPIAYEYDALGRVTRDKQGKYETQVAWRGGALASVASTVGLPLAFEYDAAGELHALTAGKTRAELRFPFEKDWLTYLGDHLVLRETMTPMGRIARRALARFDATVPIEISGTDADPGLLEAVEYDYDDVQSLRGEKHRDGKLVTYDTDLGRRVTRRRVARGATLLDEEEIAYDAAGTPIVSGVKYDAAMRPVEVRGERLGYDAAGRLATRETDAGRFTYVYNGLDQLVRVDAPGRVVDMEYDGKGRRMKKRVRQGKKLVRDVSYVWSEETLLHEHDAVTGVTRTYLRHPDEWQPFGHVDVKGGVETPCFYLLAPGGGLESAVDERGRPVWQARTSLFGDAHPTKEDVDVTVRFANQQYDADVGLVYNRHRWYDPRTGQYTSCDPALLEGHLGPRNYASNPLAVIDPMGAFPHPGVGSGKDTKKHHPSPSSPAAKKPNGVAGLNGSYLSGPGHWSTDGEDDAEGNFVPGYAECPENALHKGSGFGSAKDPTSAQGIVDAAGAAYGCHSCGAKQSGYKDKNHWCCDHQPPRSTYSKKNAGKAGSKKASSDNVRLYPHCKNCANKQGGQMNSLTKDEKVKKGKKVMNAQAS